MKALTLTLLLSCAVSLSFAQKNESKNEKVQLPKTANTITFERVVDNLEASHETLFNLAQKWFYVNYPGQENEIKIAEPSKGNLMAVANLYNFSQEILANQRRVNFIIDIVVRDNKARIRISNLQERIITDADRSNFNHINITPYESIDKAYQLYLDETIFPNQNKAKFEYLNTNFNQILKSFELFMKSQSTIKDDF